MAKNKQQQTKRVTGPTIYKEIVRCSKLSKHEYAPTQYDANDKPIDDALDQEDEKTYWESFICSKQARELERRLAIVEADDYEEGSQEFQQMENDDNDIN